MASQVTSLTVVYSNFYSDADQRKHQSSASLTFVWGIHRDRWIPRTKGQLRGKCFHLMTSLCFKSLIHHSQETHICVSKLGCHCMMTSSNGNIFRATGPLCGEFTGPGAFPTQRPVTRSFDVFFDLRLNKRLSKQPGGWWFETPPWSLWRQCNGFR